MNHFLFRAVLLPLVALLTAHCAYGSTVQLSGEAVWSFYPNFQAKVNQAWATIENTYLSLQNAAPPEVHFSEFSLEKQDRTWTEWQRTWLIQHPEIWTEWAASQHLPSPTSEWIEEHLESQLPFPKHFHAIFYKGTNKIQVNPSTTFYPFLQNAPGGGKLDFVGFGFYSISHELLHYALEKRGIPSTRLHHCIFVSPKRNGASMVEDTAASLIHHEIAHPMVMMLGPAKEKALNPCSRLTADEKSLAEQFALELP